MKQNPMNLEEFITKWSGKPLDNMELLHHYLSEVLEVTSSIEDCINPQEIFTDFTDEAQFEKIPDDPNGLPLKGDILVYGEDYKAGGYVSIWYSGDVHQFKSFGVNEAVAQLNDANYVGILGWLRAKEKV